mmetsp:Transcript_4004/g.8904  ORF Transcript_4004/g.8904 Transcript_4004/m.8904 type:complete len:119 (+) Transcript_4004:24-380(+)
MDRSQPYGKGKGRGKGSARSWRPRPQRIAARVRPQVIYDTRKYDGTIEDFVERLADTLNCFSDSIERSPPAAGVIELKANGCCVEFHEDTHTQCWCRPLTGRENCTGVRDHIKGSLVL